jgi:hypothetical protein
VERTGIEPAARILQGSIAPLEHASPCSPEGEVLLDLPEGDLVTLSTDPHLCVVLIDLSLEGVNRPDDILGTATATNLLVHLRLLGSG